MKYKLKLEITYPNMDKETIRDLKLDIISTDVITEIESDTQVSAPSKNDEITIGDIDYIVYSFKYSLDKDYYTTIVYVVNKEALQLSLEKERIEKEEQSRMVKSSMCSSIVWSNR